MSIVSGIGDFKEYFNNLFDTMLKDEGKYVGGIKEERVDGKIKSLILSMVLEEE